MAQSKKGGGDIAKQALQLHKKLGGKITVHGKVPVRSRDDLSMVYTPGVGAVSSFIAQHQKEARAYTIKRNSVAVISDGSAVLGLGNIGPEAALPVMEGKAMLFKTFADIDAFPIVLNTQDPKEVIATVQHIAPTFGGINLEDFAAPHCFTIEEELKKTLSIPVMHDDQHGTAIVVLAGLINACVVEKKNLKKTRIVIVGAGAAGVALAKLLIRYGVKDIIVADREGIISKKRSGLAPHKKELAKITNPRNISGDLAGALSGTDIVIGVSGPDKLNARDISQMAAHPIVFALANPIPEIMPKEARKGGARVIATGRSDFPNQVNNALAFPGIFRGALDHNVRAITDAMKLKAAEQLALLIQAPTRGKILPALFDKRVVPTIARVIR